MLHGVPPMENQAPPSPKSCGRINCRFKPLSSGEESVWLTPAHCCPVSRKPYTRSDSRFGARRSGRSMRTRRWQSPRPNRKARLPHGPQPLDPPVPRGLEGCRDDWSEFWACQNLPQVVRQGQRCAARPDVGNPCEGEPRSLSLTPRMFVVSPLASAGSQAAARQRRKLARQQSITDWRYCDN